MGSALTDGLMGQVVNIAALSVSGWGMCFRGFVVVLRVVDPATGDIADQFYLTQQNKKPTAKQNRAELLSERLSPSVPSNTPPSPLPT